LLLNDVVSNLLIPELASVVDVDIITALLLPSGDVIPVALNISQFWRNQ